MLLFYILIGVAGLLVLWLIVQWITSAPPAHIMRALKWLAGIAGGIVTLWLLLSGRLIPALVSASLLMPMLARWKGLYNRLRNLGGPRAGQATAVETPWLRMTLDHDSGAMDGTVLAGVWRGRRLGEMSVAELLALLAEVRVSDPDGSAVLEAYLDRARPDWRVDANSAGAAGPGEAAPAAPSGAMTREEAHRILGLEPGADERAIREAHRRLMLKLHPDQGGSTYLAAKINQAKDLLLGD